MDLALTLLGETKFSLNGKPIKKLSAVKAYALLIYLVVDSNHAHRRDALAEMFWPEKPEGYGRNNLKQTLSILRAALGDRQSPEPFIISSNRDLQFNTNSDFQVDLLKFEDLTRKVQKHCHSTENTCEKCAVLLGQAAALYRDDFLVDFYLSDSPEFNEWVLTRRESSKRLMADILGRLISCYQELRDYKNGKRFAKKLVDLEPWSESNHRRLIALLAASGKRSAALKQYHACEAMLASEFNVEPTQDTISLYEKIKIWKPSDGNQDSFLKFPAEPSTVEQITAKVQQETSHLKYWVIGSLTISLFMFIWFGYTNWILVSDQPILVNLKTTGTDNLPQTLPDIPAADQIQVAIQAAPEVQSYLQGVNPNHALAAIYSQTGGSTWIQNDGWLKEKSPCTWYGITCQGNNIVEIRLPNNNLEGRLPPEMGDIPTLIVLDISNNQIKGPIPSEIGFLANLESLNLEGNFEIRGEIPPEIGNLHNLEELILSSASAGGSLLSGELPTEIGDLIKLDKLIIENTMIQGPIPPQLGNLSKLSVLSLAHNNLSGPLPDEIFDLSKLRSLDLWANRNLNGTISSKIGRLTHLDFLNISDNQFSGNLPAEMGTLINLDWIGFHDNAFEGALPLSLTELNPSVFQFENTNLCEPADPIFQDWLDTISGLSRTGVTCDDNSTDRDHSTFSPTENDPYVISSKLACLPEENFLYLEDFQDNQAQGWPEIEFRSQNWDIVVGPEKSGNLVAQNSGSHEAGSYLQDYEFENAVWRVDFYKIGDPEYVFIWHHEPDPYENESGIVYSSDYNFAFQFDGTHFYRAADPLPHVILLGIRRTIQSGVWHELEISSYQDSVEVWLDGKQLLNYKDPDPLPGGKLGLTLWPSQSDGSMVYFDNLIVCGLSDPFVSMYSDP